jgi:hypothetical protein
VSSPTPTGSDPPPPLPTVIATSVIRSSVQGQSHGGVYLVDLASGDVRLVLDWDEVGINWEGRGGDRGLRGVAFWEGQVYLAASDEVFVYDPGFQRIRSFRNPYLSHCHEIWVHGDDLWLTSTKYDSILRYDLRGQRFTAGCCLRPSRAAQVAVKAVSRLREAAGRTEALPRARLLRFDPNQPGGPERGDVLHLNSVSADEDGVYVSGVKVDTLYRLDGDRLSRHARIPAGTHNARPYEDGVIMNDTVSDRVVFCDREANPRVEFPIRSYADEELRNADLAQGHARAAFGRGLATWKGRYLIAGSSPATISVFDLATGAVCCSVNLSMDVRNAIHGLEVWPFPPVA